MKGLIKALDNIDLAIKLLKAYKENKFKENNFFSSGLKLCFNPESGYVFLSDDYYTTGLLNDKGSIEEWVWCSYCRKENFKSELTLKDCCGYCEDCHSARCEN